MPTPEPHLAAPEYYFYAWRPRVCRKVRLKYHLMLMPRRGVLIRMTLFNAQYTLLLENKLKQRRQKLWSKIRKPKPKKVGDVWKESGFN